MATKGTVGQLLVSMRADLSGLKTDVKELENTFRSSFANVQNMATNFGRGILTGLIGGLSVGAVTAFVKSVVELGGRLSDLSAQTGISVQALSGIKSTLEENGTSVDAFANGIFRLQKEIGATTKETDPIRQAIKQLGLSFEELTRIPTEEFVKKVTDALGKQENPLNRNAIAFQLFGKSARELIPAILELAGKFDELKKRGINEADAKKLDQFGDALTRLGNNAKILAAGPLAALISQFDRLLGLTEQGRLTQKMVDLANEIEKVEGTIRLRESHQGFFGQLFGLPSDTTEPTKRLQALKEELAGVGGELGKLRAGSGDKPIAPFIPPQDIDSIKKATDQAEQFVAALKKQQDALLINITELGGGGQAAKALALDFDFLAFKAKLAAEKIPLPKGIETTFQKLKEEILLLNIELGKTAEIVNRVAIDEKDWADTMEAINKASIAPQIAADNLELQRRDELAQMMAKDFDDVAAATREWADAEAKRLRDADMARVQDTADFAKSISGSLTQGIRNTLQGIETGQQSLSEGMKNLARNMALELQFALLDQTIMQPLKAGIEGFVMGLVGTLDDTIKNQMKEWGESAGKWLSQFFADLFQGSAGSPGGGGGGGSGIFSGIGSWISSLFTFDQGGSIPFSRGMLATIPHFDSGGLFIGHGGEYVLQKSSVDSLGRANVDLMNKTGRMPSGGGATQVSLDFQGAQIIPRAPWTTPEDVIKVGVKHLNDDGTWVSIIGHRMSRK